MKKFRSFRNKKKHLSSKYILLILTGVCIVALFTSLVFNLSGGPLNSVAGYVFVPMQKGINNAGSWISGKANDFQTLGEVLKENKKLQNQVDDLTAAFNPSVSSIFLPVIVILMMPNPFAVYLIQEVSWFHYIISTKKSNEFYKILCMFYIFIASIHP